jgi:hypothetical protein
MKISEKMLEDWICEHPEEALWDEVEIIGRQIRLSHGVLDVLAFDARTIVIELKARPLKEKDIGQLLRYVHDIKDCLLSIGMAIKPVREGPLTIREELFQTAWYDYHDIAESLIQHIIPVLIGTSADSKVLAAASAVDAEVRLWNYDENEGFRISYPRYLSLVEEMDTSFPDWLLDLNKRITDCCTHDAEVLFMQQVAELFGQELTYEES